MSACKTIWLLEKTVRSSLPSGTRHSCWRWGLQASQSPLQRCQGQKGRLSGDQQSTEEIVGLDSSNKENADPHAACELPGMCFGNDNICEDDVPIVHWTREEKDRVLLNSSAVSKNRKYSAPSALLELRHFRWSLQQMWFSLVPVWPCNSLEGNFAVEINAVSCDYELGKHIYYNFLCVPLKANEKGTIKGSILLQPLCGVRP